MPPTFEQSQDDIAQLVRHFSINRDAYRGPNYKEAHTRRRLQRLIDATDQQIDALLYELYGLTAEEIAIVEGGGETQGEIVKADEDHSED